MAVPIGKLDLTAGKHRVAIRYREDGVHDVRDLQSALWLLSQATEAVKIMIGTRQEAYAERLKAGENTNDQ